MALLGKWWWKVLSGNRWCGDAVFCENYFKSCPHWNIFHRQPRRRSFFWNGILHSLPACRLNLVTSVHDGTTTLFWLDNWLDDRAPVDIWSHFFRLANDKEGSVKELIGRADFLPLDVFPLIWRLINNINASSNPGEDRKCWRLFSNGAFTVKSFYQFLNDGGYAFVGPQSSWKDAVLGRLTFSTGLHGIIRFFPWKFSLERVQPVANYHMCYVPRWGGIDESSSHSVLSGLAHLELLWTYVWGPIWTILLARPLGSLSQTRQEIFILFLGSFA